MRLFENVISNWSNARPGRVEIRGDKVVGAILLDRGWLEFDDDDDLLRVLVSGRDVLQQMREARHQRDAAQHPIPTSGHPARPYARQEAHPAPAPAAAPLPVVPSRGAHAAPTPPGVTPVQEGQVVPDPSRAAAP